MALVALSNKPLDKFSNAVPPANNTSETAKTDSPADVRPLRAHLIKGLVLAALVGAGLWYARRHSTVVSSSTQSGSNQSGIPSKMLAAIPEVKFVSVTYEAAIK